MRRKSEPKKNILADRKGIFVFTMATVTTPYLLHDKSFYTVESLQQSFMQNSALF